jgi:uncharacterized protein YqgQ
MITRWIEVSFTKEGIHKYPAALTDPKLAGVAFLGHDHRHIFHYYVRLEVFHDDREVEFILFKRELEEMYSSGVLQHDYKSCEMLAEDLINEIAIRYPNRKMVVKVFEDNESGAVLEFDNAKYDIHSTH